MEKDMCTKSILDKIYLAEEEYLDEILLQENQKLKDQLQEVNLEKIKEQKCLDEVKAVIEQMDENYSIKIAAYNEAMYKQGFIDGVHLMQQCFKENKKICQKN